MKEYCSNPYKFHSVPRSDGLRQITERDREKVPTLQLGKYWCNMCRIATVPDKHEAVKRLKPKPGNYSLLFSYFRRIYF